MPTETNDPQCVSRAVQPRLEHVVAFELQEDSRRDRVAHVLNTARSADREMPHKVRSFAVPTLQTNAPNDSALAIFERGRPLNRIDL